MRDAKLEARSGGQRQHRREEEARRHVMMMGTGSLMEEECEEGEMFTVQSRSMHRGSDGVKEKLMAVPNHCQALMNAYCDANCLHVSTHGPLVAAEDRAMGKHELAWRCYARTALDAAGLYAGESTAYCTRHSALQQILDSCESESPSPSLVLEAEAETKQVSIDASTSAASLAITAAPLRAEHLPWDYSSNQVVTLSAVDSSTWVPTEGAEFMKVHAWSLPCIDDPKQHHLMNRTGNVSRRKAFLSRKGLACAGRCVRGVVDGFATHEEMSEMRAITPEPYPGHTSGIKTWKWDVTGYSPDGPVPKVFDVLVQRSQAVLAEWFGIPRTRFYRSNMITWQGDRGPAESWPRVPRAWFPNSLHGDTNTDEMFLYTTILYLSQHGDDVRGGETGIADVVVDLSRGSQVTAGLRVEPSIGRLLVFSSGVENMHEMLPVTHGRRVAVQMWFACEGLDPGWAREQRVAWGKEHGWGGPVSHAAPGANPSVRPTAPPPPERPLARPWAWR